MSLSKLPKSDRGELSTFQLLLDIAISLQSLVSDPKALEKAATTAFALSEENEKKAQTVYADIDRADMATKEAIKQQSIASELIRESKQAKMDASAHMDMLRKEQNRFATKEAEQGAYALKLSNQEADLKDRESKLTHSWSELNKQLAALADNQRKLNEDKSQLRAKAEKLRSIVGE